MLVVTYTDGRRLVVEVYGKYSDDIQIDGIYFEDEPKADVPDEVVDWVMDNCSDEMYDEWYENQCEAAEAWADSMEDR